jgi:hypothetical protein
MACSKLDSDGDGFDELSGDCDDNDPQVNPAAIEICDEKDNDCNGEIDELGAVGGLIFYVDLDGDGHGSENATLEACTVPQGYSTSKRDCDESDAAVNPDAEEICDGIDNDCDTHVDEYTAVDAQVWHPDRDGDGYGDIETEILGCEAPPDHILDGSDCDDIDPGVNPGASEDCATPFDDDCDGELNDIDAFGCTPFYADLDGDGFGGSSQCLCEADGTYSFEAGGDCDDERADVHPGAEEVVDFLDNDCQDGAPYPMSEAAGQLRLSHSSYYVSQLTGGDYDGDGLAEVWVGDEYKNTVHLLRDPSFENPVISESGVTLYGTDEAKISKYQMATLDVNGDGLDDLIVSHFKSDEPGLVYSVFQGPFTEDLVLEDAVTQLETDSETVSQNLLSGGDLNGDGLADLVFGDPYYDAQIAGTIGVTENTGKASIFFSPLSGELTLDDADVTLTGDVVSDYLAADMMTGDFDGDGVMGLVLSSQGAQHSYNRGDVRLYHDVSEGHFGGIGPGPDAIITSSGFFTYIGFELGGAGDFNGDGHQDLLLSTRHATYTSARTIVLYGPFADGMTEIGELPYTTFYRETESGQPNAVEVVGDVTGDGADDFLIGDYYDGGGGYGAVYLVHSPPEGFIDLPYAAVKFSTERTISSRMGSTRTSLNSRRYRRFMSPGDIDGDGLNDLVIGARQLSPDDATIYSHLSVVWGVDL